MIQPSQKIIWQNKPNSYEGDIRYQILMSDAGELFVAGTDQGICQLSFMVDGRRDEPLRTLIKQWPMCFYHNQPLVVLPMEQADPVILLHDLLANSPALHICGTVFQQQVWQALLEIPQGKTTSYGVIAKALDNSRATQAVGSAVGANPIAIIIPCHRVLAANGELGNYHWGADIKERLLKKEGAQFV